MPVTSRWALNILKIEIILALTLPAKEGVDLRPDSI
jgi:hypothetical protein